MLGTPLDDENTEMNKMGKISAFMGHVGGGGRGNRSQVGKDDSK